MVGTGSSPDGARQTGPAAARLLPSALVALCAVIAIAVVPPAARLPVAVCGGAAAAAVALVSAEAARRGRALAALRAQFARREAALRQRLALQETATARLADEILPEAVLRLQRGEFVEDVMAAADFGEGMSPQMLVAHQAVLHSVVRAVDAEDALRESAQRAFVNIARRVQAIVNQQAWDLRAMEDRHGENPRVFADLLRLDHGNALIGRLADSIAVLGGARPGRQWSKPVPLFSVLRGAMSRILDYQRVELHSVVEAAVVGPAVEPLIHALAELLDNATRYSPPKTRVHLTALEVQAGVAIEIEDGGVSLSEEARARAERMLTQAKAGIDLTDLGETPRLGMAVVGRLSQRCNFQVSLRPSAYGGVRAVVVVPRALLTTAPATGRAHGIGAGAGAWPDAAPAARAAGGPALRAAANSGLAGEDADVAPVLRRTANGLPRRRRRRSAAVASPAVPAAGPGSGAPTSAETEPGQPGMWLADFQSGLTGERAPANPSRPSGLEPGEGEQP